MDSRMVNRASSDRRPFPPDYIYVQSYGNNDPFSSPASVRLTRSVPYDTTGLHSLHASDRITRYATGRSKYNNLEAPVSVLDCRKRSSSVGQFSDRPLAAPGPTANVVRRSRLPRQSHSTVGRDCAESRRQVVSGNQTQHFFTKELPENAEVEVEVEVEAEAETPTSPGCAKKAEISPMQTSSSTVLQSGPLQVFLFKQTNVTVLTRPPVTTQGTQSHPESPMLPPASVRKFKGARAMSMKEHSDRGKHGTEQRKLHTSFAASIRRVPSESATGNGLSSMVHKILRRISPAGEEHSSRLSLTNSLVRGLQQSPESKADHDGESDASSATTSGVASPNGIPRNHRPASSSRRLGRSNNFSVSFDHSHDLNHNHNHNHNAKDFRQSEQTPASIKGRGTSFNLNATKFSSHATNMANGNSSSIIDRLMKIRSSHSYGKHDTKQMIRAQSVHRDDPNDTGVFSKTVSECQSATSTPRPRGTQLSLRFSQPVISCATTTSCTTSVTSDKASSEISSGAIADAEESATEESDIFTGRCSPSAPAAASVGKQPFSISAESGIKSTPRLPPNRRATSIDTGDLSTVAHLPCRSESERLHDKAALKTRGCSPKQNRCARPNSNPNSSSISNTYANADWQSTSYTSSNRNEPLLEMNERESRTAFKSPESQKAIKLSLVAFGYCQKPYCAERGLKCLDDLLSPPNSPTCFPRSAAVAVAVATSRKIKFALTPLLGSSSKHESLRQLFSPPMMSAAKLQKLKIRRTSSM